MRCGPECLSFRRPPRPAPKHAPHSPRAPHTGRPGPTRCLPTGGRAGRSPSRRGWRARVGRAASGRPGSRRGCGRRSRPRAPPPARPTRRARPALGRCGSQPPASGPRSGGVGWPGRAGETRACRHASGRPVPAAGLLGSAAERGPRRRPGSGPLEVPCGSLSLSLVRVSSTYPFACVRGRAEGRGEGGPPGRGREERMRSGGSGGGKVGLSSTSPSLHTHTRKPLPHPDGAGRRLPPAPSPSPSPHAAPWPSIRPPSWGAGCSRRRVGFVLRRGEKWRVWAVWALGKWPFFVWVGCALASLARACAAAHHPQVHTRGTLRSCRTQM